MEKTPTSSPVWDMLADRWHTTLRAKSLSTNTERTYLYTARRWSEWLAARGLDLDPAEVRAHHTEDFIADIIAATSAANGAHHYRNLRVYLGWVAKRERIPTGNPMNDTEPPRVRRKLIPILTEEDQAKVFATCDGRDFASVRDKAIMLLFRDTGLRVSELCSVDTDDIDFARRCFKVIGKGGGERWVGFGPDAGLALARYLKLRAKRTRTESARLWLGRRGKPMNRNGIRDMLVRRGEQAGISGRLFPHRWRHDFTDKWKRRGGSDEGLMTIAGWTSMKMAHHYGQSARTERALAEQQRLLTG